MRKVVMVIFTMITLLCVGERFASAHINQEAAKKTSNLGAPELDRALEAELDNALKPVCDLNFISQPAQNPEMISDFESVMAANILATKDVRTYKLARLNFTAYYGPQKNQGDYYHGSYKKDVAINGSGKQTAYGTKPRIGIIATDPRILPRGTQILMADPLTGIEKVYIAEDKGSAIKGRRIDIFAGFGREGLKRARLIQKMKRDIIVKIIKPQPTKEA